MAQVWLGTGRERERGTTELIIIMKVMMMMMTMMIILIALGNHLFRSVE